MSAWHFFAIFSRRRTADMCRGVLYGLFFLSGVSALIYELVWQRLLNLVFGVSTLSVSAVLAGFMGGLALGGLLFGRRADRTPRPLRFYAWLEAGIGATGLLVPPAFAILITVYTSLCEHLEPGPWGGACLRLGLSFLVMVVPATLIGGTLPVMGRLAWRPNGGLPATFSLLYAMNTLGAMLGAALTGFVLLRFLGMQQTLWIAAGLNFLVALGAGLSSIAWALNSRPAIARPVGLEDSARPAITSTPRGPIGHQIEAPAKAALPFAGASGSCQGSPRRASMLSLGCAGVTGAVSMGLEVGWTRILGILTSNSAYGFALLLTVLLLGLGLGSLVQAWWSRYRGDGWRRLAFCQWLLAAITLTTLPFFRAAPEWLDRWCDGSSVAAVFLGESILTAGALLLPAILMGMSLPLLVTGETNAPGRFGNWLGRIYAVNTLGCVVGAFLTGFIFIPWLGIQATFGVLVAATLVVGIAAWGRATQPALPRRCLVGGLVLLAGAGGWNLLPVGVFLKSHIEEPRHLLHYHEGNNATVTVVEEYDGTRSILVDGQPVAGTVCTSVVDQKMLAHLPLLLHPAPRRALTVGFGSGGTSYSMTLHDVDVVCVEIEGAVPAAAEFFRSENHGVRSHPRYRLILDDARSWLRVAPEHYDVIATDCTNIQYRSNGDLYTVDYFRLLQDRLRPNGLAAAWVPANGIHDTDLKTLLRSFRAVFPHTSVWFMNCLPTDFLIVIGTPAVLDIDLDDLRRRMRRPGVAEDLEAVGLADPGRLVYTFLAADEDLIPYLGSGSLNTDDRPGLSYTTYGAMFRSTIAANLVRLRACRSDVTRFIKHPAPAETMLRYYAASNELILGHIAHWAGAEQEAQVHYGNSARLMPPAPTLQGRTPPLRPGSNGPGSLSALGRKTPAVAE
jgi:spermidine synthase